MDPASARSGGRSGLIDARSAELRIFPSTSSLGSRLHNDSPSFNRRSV